MGKAIISLVLVSLVVAIFLNGYNAEDGGSGNQPKKDDVSVLFCFDHKHHFVQCSHHMLIICSSILSNLFKNIMCTPTHTHTNSHTYPHERTLA